MTIQKDAGEILLFIYEKYTGGVEYLDAKQIVDTTKWDAGRINRAIHYLNDLGSLKMNFYMGNTNGVHNFGIMGLTPEGIQTVESKDHFKRNFGFTVNLGLFSYSWGASEK
jgi:hypothetical protein